MERFLKDPNHHAGCDPGVGRTRNLEVPIILGAKTFGEAIAAYNDRQCAERSHWNHVPQMNTGRISGERREDGETGEKMRVPGKRVVTKRTCGLG